MHNQVEKKRVQRGAEHAGVKPRKSKSGMGVVVAEERVCDENKVGNKAERRKNEEWG